MKKTILIFALYVMLAVIIMTGCETPAEKVENSKNNLDNAQKTLDKANSAYQAEVQNYRKEMSKRIAANDKILADFKERVEHDKKNAKAEYNKKIDELEQKNTDLKKEIDQYTEAGITKWEEFKLGFNHDIDALGKALDDLTGHKIK
jgi:chromosome segregation ATPase